MLERHLIGKPAKIGVGANRAAVAACYFEIYGYSDPRSSTCYHLHSTKIGAVILDDGMQVLGCCLSSFAMLECSLHLSGICCPAFFSPSRTFF